MCVSLSFIGTRIKKIETRGFKRWIEYYELLRSSSIHIGLFNEPITPRSDELNIRLVSSSRNSAHMNATQPWSWSRISNDLHCSIIILFYPFYDDNYGNSLYQFDTGILDAFNNVTRTANVLQADVIWNLLIFWRHKNCIPVFNLCILIARI